MHEGCTIASPTLALLELDGLAKELVGHGHGEGVTAAVRVDEDRVVWRGAGKKQGGSQKKGERRSHVSCGVEQARSLHLSAQVTWALKTSRCCFTVGPGFGWPEDSSWQ